MFIVNIMNNREIELSHVLAHKNIPSTFTVDFSNLL